MRLATPTCPHCRERAVAALETVPITMSFEGDPREGSVRYGDGANNVLDWNHQRPVVGPGGRPLVVCVNGHQWETVIEDETRTRPHLLASPCDCRCVRFCDQNIPSQRALRKMHRGGVKVPRC